MPQELSYPFGLSPTGAINFTTDQNVIALQHVESLVCTNPGERVMLPTYGVPTSSYVFENGVDSVVAGISNDVEQGLAFWEPTINVINVQPIIQSNNESYGVAAINVEFTQTDTTTTGQNVATVEIGGNVLQSVQVNAT